MDRPAGRKIEFSRLSGDTVVLGSGQRHDKDLFKTCDTDCPGQDMNIKKLSANHIVNCIKTAQGRVEVMLIRRMDSFSWTSSGQSAPECQSKLRTRNNQKFQKL